MKVITLKLPRPSAHDFASYFAINELGSVVLSYAIDEVFDTFIIMVVSIQDSMHSDAEQLISKYKKFIIQTITA